MARKMTILIAAVVALVAAGARADTPLAARIDAYLAPLVDAGQVSGTLLVARGDDVIYERSFGLADAERSIPNAPDLPSCVASITKPMTLVVAIKLIEAGKIGMNDPLEKWFPGFPRGDRITFLHVLRHRAGFPHRVTTDEEENSPITGAEMVERMIAQVTRDGFLAEPGARSIYSSAGYSVAARMCELAAGAPFQQVIRDSIFAPAGMTHSFDPRPGEALPPHAESYTDTWPGVRATDTKDYAFLVGAGSVFSTAHDVYAFLHAVVDTVYGAGARASLDRDGGMSENGITNGYRAFADYTDSTGVYVVFTGNRYTGATDWLRADIPRIVAGEDVAARAIPSITRAALTDEQAQALAGAWVSTQGSPMTVTVRDGLVYAGWYSLIPTSPTTFFAPGGYGTATFTVEHGRAVRLDWAMADTTQPNLVWTRPED